MSIPISGLSACTDHINSDGDIHNDSGVAITPYVCDVTEGEDMGEMRPMRMQDLNRPSQEEVDGHCLTHLPCTNGADPV